MWLKLHSVNIYVNISILTMAAKNGDGAILTSEVTLLFLDFFHPLCQNMLTCCMECCLYI